MSAIKDRYFRAFFLTSLTAAFAVVSHAQNFSPRAEEMVFSPVGEHFSVKFPGTPKREVENTSISYTYTKNGNFYGMVVETNRPTAGTPVDEILQGEINGFAKGFNGTVLTLKKSINGLDGRMNAVIESGSGRAFIAAYRVDGRMYTLAFATLQENDFPTDAYTFLNSFTVIK